MLKKIAIIIASVAMAANAFAAATEVTSCLSSDAGAWATANIKFVPSKSVVLGYKGGTPADAAGANNSVYSIASKNTSGDSTYGATSASTTIVFSKNLVAGTAIDISAVPTLPTDPSDSTISGGADNWSVL